jgi:hypothetical protein
MLDVLRRLLTALVIFVFVLPLSVIVVVFSTIVFILGLILKLYDAIAKTDKYNVLVEFLFVCYGLAIFLITMPYHILTDN